MFSHQEFSDQTPNSWTYNFVEVFGHNLESSLTWGFFLHLLNHREWVCFLSGFPPFFFTVYSSWTVETVIGCASLKKYKSQGKAMEVTANGKEEISYNFWLDFSKNSASERKAKKYPVRNFVYIFKVAIYWALSLSVHWDHNCVCCLLVVG